MLKLRLDAASLFLAATIVGHGSGIKDGLKLKTSGLQATNGLLTTCADTFDENLNLLDAIGSGLFHKLFGRDRGGVRSGLSGPLKPTRTCAGLSQNIALIVRQGHKSVVVGGDNMNIGLLNGSFYLLDGGG